MNTNLTEITEEAIELLKQLIAIPSFSREEDKTAEVLFNYVQAKGFKPQRQGNNVWVKNTHFDAAKPTILLNSHHDTVKPNPQYSRDPFHPEVIDGKLFGLGSNDAGGCLVSLLATFLHFGNQENLKYNLIWAGTAEEEVGGKDGVESILSHLGEIDFAIVGEPTEMHLAVAEKGLLVVDCECTGKAGHAARNEGINAMYLAVEDLTWIRNYKFQKVSKWLGEVKMTATIINAGSQHNVVPAKCNYTLDIRLNEHYSYREVVDLLNANLNAECKERSTRIKPSFIPEEHPFVQAGKKIGRELYGSPTTSDQALIPFTSVKCGPGKSERSHSADEFVLVKEIEEGVQLYVEMLSELIIEN